MHAVKENKGSNYCRGTEHIERKKKREKREKLSQTLTKEGAKESSEIDLPCTQVCSATCDFYLEKT